MRRERLPSSTAAIPSSRQIVDGDEPLIEGAEGEKPLSIAVEELNQGKIRILAENEPDEETYEEEDVVFEETDEEEYLEGDVTAE